MIPVLVQTCRYNFQMKIFTQMGGDRMYDLVAAAENGRSYGSDNHQKVFKKWQEKTQA